MDEQRARAHVKGLVDRGRLTPEQARDFYDLLLAPHSPTADQAKIAKLRAALKRVQQRIGYLVRKGDLTAEEGRRLSAIFEARAKAALPDASGPAKRRVDGNQRSGAGARRVPAGNQRSGPDARRVPTGKRGGGQQGGGKQQPASQRVGNVRTLKPIRAAGNGERKDG